MSTLSELARILSQELRRRGITQETLSKEAGISRQTLSKVLSGSADFKTTTLLALADRLGLKVVLLPKEVAGGLTPEKERQVQVKSGVQRALERIEDSRRDASGKTQ